MYYYKIQAKAFDSKAKIWIVVSAVNIREAVQKAHDQCANFENIFYALEETLQEISSDEYKSRMRQK